MSKIKNFFYTGTALGILASINSYISARTPALKSVLQGEEKYYKWSYGDIFYKVRGEGKNILLLHGIYPGGSSFEWIKNFNYLSKKFRVYAPDLVGFGKSAKLKKSYRANLYVKLIFEFIDDVIDGECIIIGSSLCSSYSVRVASLNSNKISHLILVSPPAWDRPQKPEILNFLTYQLLSLPVVGTSIYNTFSSRFITRYNLENNVYSNKEAVTRDMINQYHVSSHQKGAANLFPSLATELLNLNVAEDFKTLGQHIWVLLGKKIKTPPTRTVEKLKILNSNTRYKLFDNCGLMPHCESSEEFNKFIEKILLHKGNFAEEKNKNQNIALRAE